MKQYRLKKEAVPFFNEKHATAIHSLDTWDSYQVEHKALEEVEDAYIYYGIKTSEIASSLSGWSKENASHFHFTIVFPSVKYQEHDRFNKGRITRKLMDQIQSKINNFYSDFVNEKIDD